MSRLLFVFIVSLGAASMASTVGPNRPPTTRPSQMQPSSETHDEYWTLTVIEVKASEDTSRRQYIVSIDRTDKKMRWKRVDESIFPRDVLKRLIVGKAVRLHWRQTIDANGAWSIDLVGIKDVKVPRLSPTDWDIEGLIAQKELAGPA